ncbi:hypothetical protein ACFIOY_32300 [Bradyrhizobium sp. TZ2]
MLARSEVRPSREFGWGAVLPDVFELKSSTIRRRSSLFAINLPTAHTSSFGSAMYAAMTMRDLTTSTV